MNLQRDLFKLFVLFLTSETISNCVRIIILKNLKIRLVKNFSKYLLWLLSATCWYNKHVALFCEKPNHKSVKCSICFVYLYVICTNGFGPRGGSGKCFPAREEVRGEAEEKPEYSVTRGWVTQSCCSQPSEAASRYLSSCQGRPGSCFPLGMGHTFVHASSPCRGVIGCTAHCTEAGAYSLACSFSCC